MEVVKWGQGSERKNVNRKVSIKDFRAKIKFEKTIRKQVEGFKGIIAQFPESGQTIKIVTSKSFNALSVVSEIVSRSEVDEFYLAIYRMNIQAVEYLIQLSKEKPDTVFNIILSSFFRENKKYERWTKNLIDHCETQTNTRLFFGSSHAKVLAISDKNGNFYVFEGSGNLSDNARIEQYTFENSRESFEFHKAWMEWLLEKQ